MNNLFKKVNCCVCGSNDFASKINSVFDNELLKCLNCGLVFLINQPSWSDLKKIYSQEYFKNDNSHLYGYQDYYEDKPNIVKTFEGRMKKIQQIHSGKGNMLD